MRIVKVGMVPSEPKIDRMQSDLELGSDAPDFDASLFQQRLARAKAKREAEMLERHNLLRQKLDEREAQGLNQQDVSAGPVSQDVT